MKLKPLLSQLFGVGRRAKTENFKVSLPTATTPQRPVTARRSKHSDFPSKSMRRGVQRARELQQRPDRLERITNSVIQGIVIRNLFRKKQLLKREIRAELRKAGA